MTAFNVTHHDDGSCEIDLKETFHFPGGSLRGFTLTKEAKRDLIRQLISKELLEDLGKLCLTVEAAHDDAGVDTPEWYAEIHERWFGDGTAT